MSLCFETFPDDVDNDLSLACVITEVSVPSARVWLTLGRVSSTLRSSPVLQPGQEETVGTVLQRLGRLL